MTEVATDDLIVLQEVERHQIACDWRSTKLHSGDGPARWVAHLVPCGCGRQGARLICDVCKDVSMTTEDCGECGKCGHIINPWRRVISRLEPL